MSPRSERRINVLVIVTELFNQTGEPVGSSAVASRDEIDVSSATIRNDMAALEERGWLYQPHTSAGRMPTWAGMRRYVDHLVEHGELAGSQDVDWQRHLRDVGDGDVESMARSTGLVISELSQLTSIVSSPEINQIRLKDLHLSWLSEDRVLVILITQDGRVFNRAVRLEEPIDRSALQRMQNFLSEQVVGLTLHEVRQQVRQKLEAAELKFREFMWRALEIGREVVEVATRSELFVEGTVNMLDISELARDVERARSVMKQLENRERVLDVLNTVCETPKPKTLIGPELGDEWGDDLSLIVCGYYHGGRQVGLVGIMGPMRMNYARLIPLVEHAAGVLSKELEELA